MVYDRAMDEKNRPYTVRRLAKLAGVSVRTLHYYDEIGLLKPSRTGLNGYRYYDEPALLRLQQILFYREMDLDLQRIKDVIDQPNFDLVRALQLHRQALEAKIQRLFTLMDTVDTTINHLTGELPMSKKKIFEGFSAEQQKAYEEEAVQQWGEDAVRPTIKRWNSYSEEKKQAIMAEGGAVYEDIIKDMAKGPRSPEVQGHLARWHQHLRYFYEPTLEILRGLGDHYHDHPEFNATFTAMHADLPAFLKEAINFYVDGLEAKK